MKRRQRGIAAVELALLLLPLLVLFFGVLEMGRAFYQYNSLVKATRGAARYLAMQQVGQGQGEATCLALSGNPAPPCSPALAPGLTAGMITIRYISGVTTCDSGTSSACGAINLVEICINCAESVEKFTFRSIAPAFMPSVTFGPIRSVFRRGAS